MRLLDVIDPYHHEHECYLEIVGDRSGTTGWSYLVVDEWRPDFLDFLNFSQVSPIFPRYPFDYLPTSVNLLHVSK